MTIPKTALPVFLLILTAPMGLRAQSTANLAARSGHAEVLRNGSWTEAILGERLSNGERLRTNVGSAALELGPGRVVILNEQTEVEFKDEGKASPTVQLHAGSMKIVSSADIQLATNQGT